MAVSKLRSGRWRAQVRRDGKTVSAASLLTPDELALFRAVNGTFSTKTEARAAAAQARLAVKRGLAREVTVRDFWQRWTTDPLFARPKRSTDLHNEERTRGFVGRFGDVPIAKVDDAIVSAWLEGGKKNGTVPALTTMFNDAASAKGGRLIHRNPFKGLGISRGTGNRDTDPPGPEVVAELIRCARTVSLPFAGWLQVAAGTGMRPGEVDALRLARVDLMASRIKVVEQFSSRAGVFQLPKNGKRREALVTPMAREAFDGMEAHYRGGEFCFRPPYAEHFSAANRAYYWNRVRRMAGYEGSLYLATRHYAGWYMTNVLLLESEIVAIVLGHTDGGALVRRLYGHRDRSAALDMALRAFEGADGPVPLRVMEGGAGA